MAARLADLRFLIFLNFFFPFVGQWPMVIFDGEILLLTVGWKTGQSSHKSRIAGVGRRVIFVLSRSASRKAGNVLASRAGK
jgi:hypothetical protein